MNRIFWIWIQNLQAPVGPIQVGFWPIRVIHEWVEGCQLEPARAPPGSSLPMVMDFANVISSGCIHGPTGMINDYGMQAIAKIPLQRQKPIVYSLQRSTSIILNITKNDIKY